MRRLVPVLALALGACVTPGDLRTLADTIEDQQAGFISREEAAERIREVADDVEERTKIPTDPVELSLYLLSLGITGVATAKGVNLARDRKRALRGEPVSVPEPPKA